MIDIIDIINLSLKAFYTAVFVEYLRITVTLFLILLIIYAILLVRNDDVGAQLVTIDSVPDPYTREGDQTQSVPAGAYRIFGSPFPSTGWLQADGKIYVDAASANVMLAVITIQD